MAAACVGLLGPTSATAQAVPDASCPGPRDGFTLQSGQARLAQTFTAQNTGALTRAQLDVEKSGSAGAYTVSINATDASGTPTNTVLASTAIPDASVPSGAGTITADFAAPADVSVGQQYAVVVTRPASDTLLVGVRNADPCPGGGFVSANETDPFAPVCGSPNICDFIFAVFVEPAPPSPSPAKSERTLTLDANKNKVKKGKKVTLSGRIVETPSQSPAGCAANQAVEVQRKKPIQTAFTTVEQVQTDAGGSFSTKEKVKKTLEYRAQVQETATCDDGLSNTEKVKAKEPQ